MATFAELGIDPTEVEEALVAGYTFPATWYGDPAIHRIELEQVFRRSWLAICSASRVAAPGDHAVGKAGDIPVIVVRGDDGALRGFVNVCRHRAFPLASCDGHRKTLQCRYHAWVYELDGSLRNAPRSEREEDFRREEFGLLPVSVEVLGGVVYANADPRAAPLASAHPLLPGLVEEWRLGLGEYTVPRRRDRCTVDANWKIYVENSSECYHCPTVHKASFGDAYDVSADEYTYVNRDRLLGQLTRPNPSAKRFTGNAGRYRYLYIWPGTFLNFDDVLASWMTVVPTAPDRCILEYEVWAHPDAPGDVVEAWEAMYQATQEEDVEVVALQQPNLSSGAVPYGRLMPGAESAIAHFHRVVWDELRATLETPSEQLAPHRR